MRLILDTHLLLWAAGRSHRLPKTVRALLEDPANDVFFSAASLWEIVIKSSLRKQDFDVDVAVLRPALTEMGFAELPISGAHAERLASLPALHNDPFDRMLVAQSLAEPLLLLTNDAVLGGYGESVKVVPGAGTDALRRLGRR
jgi:PIN domain nuclease of toxin-antitoxin system